MHGDDPVEFCRIELLAQRRAQFVLAAGGGRSRTMPSAAPRPVPRLIVMRATARIMFWKRAMLAFDHAVWFASAVR